MSKGTYTFKATDVTRALKAAKKAGVDVQVVLDLERKTLTLTPVKVAESIDENDLDKWIAAHADTTQGH
jgi:phosphatidylserine/phosphatidylglycerophosphate/cardiolipin synthase-like enzyme